MFGNKDDERAALTLLAILTAVIVSLGTAYLLSAFRVIEWPSKFDGADEEYAGNNPDYRDGTMIRPAWSPAPVY